MKRQLPTHGDPSTNTHAGNPPAAHVRADSASRGDDEAAILDLFGQLLAAWGRGDGDAYGALFTDDADYVAFDGTHTKGRTAIAASHQALFDTHLKGTRLTGTVSAIRLVAPDVAVVHASGGTIMRGRGRRSPERNSIQTLLAAKQCGAWRFTAFHNTRVRPIARGMAAFLIWVLSDTLWRMLVIGRRCPA